MVTQLTTLLNVLQTSALVVFASASSLRKALRTAAEGKALTVQFKEPTETFGLKGMCPFLRKPGCFRTVVGECMLPPAGWVEAHKAKTPGNRVLQQQLDEWMEHWESQEKQRHDTAAADAVDEGWTVVTKQRVCRTMTHKCPAWDKSGLRNQEEPSPESWISMGGIHGFVC